ncbi:MAG: DUF839 domain-containing protein [Bacteroidia bacterium]|nr:DUF839 domain-containing protein [Bacteroidia bacterium]
MAGVSRRAFLKTAALTGLGFYGLKTFGAVDESFPAIYSRFGPLYRDPRGILNLPRGFSYQIISAAGEQMQDGFLVPGKPDGMATFPGPDGLTILIRNHELESDMLNEGPFGPDLELLGKIAPHHLYDYGSGQIPCPGGTTTVVYDTAKGEVVRQFLSLAGTLRNCAGGPTPWGTWISCEETTDRKGGRLEQNHGYTFEVPATMYPSLSRPEPIKAMGRFQHEAVCVDPRTAIVYLTEDRPDGLIYRFIPDHPGKLHRGGRLQALAIHEMPSCDTRNWPNIRNRFPQNTPQAVSWIDLEDIDAPEDDLRIRGYASGAARFARGEGMWFGNDVVYFACTNGGIRQQGQIFSYRPSPDEGTPQEKQTPGTLELFLESDNNRIVNYCDNLTVSPFADLIVCEDKDHARLIGITPEGSYYVFAENVGYQSEMAGVTFSPDGTTLFVNIQHAGLTLAITGPWT